MGCSPTSMYSAVSAQARLAACHVSSDVGDESSSEKTCHRMFPDPNPEISREYVGIFSRFSVAPPKASARQRRSSRCPPSRSAGGGATQAVQGAVAVLWLRGRARDPGSGARRTGAGAQGWVNVSAHPSRRGRRRSGMADRLAPKQ